MKQSRNQNLLVILEMTWLAKNTKLNKLNNYGTRRNNRDNR